MAFMFENLQVYQKAVDLADRVATLTEAFPRGYYFLVDQLNRAALSVATNVANKGRERRVAVRSWSKNRCNDRATGSWADCDGAHVESFRARP
jgi:hypothetical protein